MITKYEVISSFILSNIYYNIKNTSTVGFVYLRTPKQHHVKNKNTN